MRGDGKFTKKIVQFLFLCLLLIFGAILVSGSLTHTASGVTINNPVANQNLSGNITINVTASNTFNLTNVTFHARMANGTVFLIGTNSSDDLNDSIAAGITFQFDTSLSSLGDGGYAIFNISANLSELNDTTYNTTIQNGSENVSISNTPPTVTLNSPANNSFVNNQTNFNFSVQSIVYPVIKSCNLTIDGTEVNGSLAITNGSSPSESSIVSIVSQSESLHKWTFVCTDSSQLNASITNRTYTEDNTNPNSTVSISDQDDADLTSSAKVDFGSKVKISCSPGDSTAGLVTNNNTISILFPGVLTYQNISTLTQNSATDLKGVLKSEETSKLGEYSIKCFTWDKAGNSNTSLFNFTVVSVVQKGTGAAAIPGFEFPVGTTTIGSGTVSDAGRLTTEGTSRLIKKGGAVTFDINGEDHKIEVSSATSTSVILVITSDPMEVNIDAGEAKTVDLNGDGISDVEITYHKLFANTYADLTFELVSVVVEKDGPGDVGSGTVSDAGNFQDKEAASSGSGLTVVLAVIAIIMVIGYALIKRKK